MPALNPALIPRPAIAACRHLQRTGGTAYLVGGCVRDMLLGRAPKDVDLEVFGIEAGTLARLLSELGKTEHVGRQFGVTKLWSGDIEIDVALPRTEKKSGTGHRGFDVIPDPAIAPERASLRRDFTINAMMYDPLGERLLDFHDGLGHLQRKILKHVSPAFAEDPLRVLRGMQFAARFDLTMDDATAELCRSLLPEADTLAVERVWQEWQKWSLAGHPARGLRVLEQSGWIALYPEAAALVGCPQEPRWHPEGDVWQHTCQVVDRAAEVAGKLDARGEGREPRTILLLAALCHDFGKPMTTAGKGDRIRSPGHSGAGIAPTRRFLQRIGAPARLNGRIEPLVREHLIHLHGEPTDRAVRRLAARLAPATIVLWEMLVEADASGRAPAPPSRPGLPWLKRAIELTHDLAKPKPFIGGSELMRLGVKPGPQMGDIIRQAYEAQLDGHFTSVEEGLVWCSKHCHMK